jgi:hypothetical protein
MAKILARLAAALAAACCTAGMALAQPHGGAVAAPAPHISAPAPHISAPVAPHISAPVAPHVSAPAPHVAATPHFSAAPRIGAAPHVATPRFSARTARVHQFTPRGHGFAARGFARQTVHGPTRHGPGRVAGRSVTRSASRNLTRRNLTRHATRTTDNLARSTARERALAERNRVTESTNRPRAATPNARIRPSRAQLAALSRPLGERNRNDNDRHRWFGERRRFHHGGFIGWFGPVFWPYAYDDFFDYAFWPAEYDAYGFWAYAYDDILDNVFFTPGTEDVYASVGGGRGAERRRGRAGSRAAAGLCRVDPGLTRWPVEEIAQVVAPTREQQNLLADLKAASDRAARLLTASCPANPPATPLGRLEAMSKRLDVMLQALDVVRPALAKFYDSLSDEQKARFNAIGWQPSAGGNAAKDEARVCGGQAPGGLTAQAIARIEQEVRPDDRQRAGLDAVRDAVAKAADELHNACPSQTPITPVARLDAMANHIKAMLDAVNTVRPALARFYDSLSDEQKAHFNVMSREASNQ